MTTPIDDRRDPMDSYDEKINQTHRHDESATLTHAPTVGSESDEHQYDPEKRSSHLNHPGPTERFPSHNQYLSPTENRDQATRLVDEIELLRAERFVSNQEAESQRSRSRGRSRSSRRDNEDVFNQPAQAPTIPKQVTEPPSKVSKAVVAVKHLPRVVRYFLYMIPIAAILLIPILLGRFAVDGNEVPIGGPGGVVLIWFGIWLEVIWLSLWAARIVTASIPYILAFVAKAGGSNNSSKWKDIGRQIELHIALFLWMLAVLISYWPVLNSHRNPPDGDHPSWMDVVWKIIIAAFVLAALNFVEKILIQWIAASFHLRTYSSRIELNRQSIAYLVHLYEYSKDRFDLIREESLWPGQGSGSGSRTPMQQFQVNGRQALKKVGDVANRVAGDFTGRQVKLSNHPRKVITELLRNSQSSQVLARRLFRTFVNPDRETLVPEDLNPAFPTSDDAEAAFSIFDRDLNGDVSMEEMEAFCDEVHREKKAIAASLKDLDSVITKLDRVFVFIIVVITIIVFISIISGSAAAALTTAGTFVLGLAWMLQATAQEFLQSIIFVFVKHPFDVGDRVTVYGNVGALMRGDDYYVTEISLLYTEFKKMEGHIVQAPNSLLNTLFILNHRRSGGLADVIELTMKFGTNPQLIEDLKARMLDFVSQNKRDYGNKIITEVRSFEDSYAVTVNFIFFHKSSYQNELLRLTRHNKFATELMMQMVSVGIEQPRRIYQIGGRDFPVYNAAIDPPAYDRQEPTQPNNDNRDRDAYSSGGRRRTDSRVSIALNDRTISDFQDVFESRKGSVDPQLHRLASLRARAGAHSHQDINRAPAIPEDNGEGPSLQPVTSAGSQRRFFGRKGTLKGDAGKMV